MTGTAPLPLVATPGTVNVCAGAIADGDVGFAADSQPTMMKIATLVVAPIQKRRMIPTLASRFAMCRAIFR